MTRKQRATEIAKILDQYYPDPEIPLDHQDPYTLLVSVVLSAQCTDARVNQVTPRLFDMAGNPARMAGLAREEIEGVIRPCGLAPSKSKAIKELSRVIAEDYNGRVPNTFEELEALPGVGHKTASVVMVQAFGEPAFPVDTHIHRLAYRWKLSTGKSVKKTEEDLKKAFPRETWGKVHLQIIYYGREYCPARAHDPNKCPICSKYGRSSLFA